jgi:hypothetical protein
VDTRISNNGNSNFRIDMKYFRKKEMGRGKKRKENVGKD